MSKKQIFKLASLAVLGVLVLVFGVVLLALAAGLFIPAAVGPRTGGVVFSISRRMSTTALVSLVALIAAALLLFGRRLWR
jgi:hypothetical protein